MSMIRQGAREVLWRWREVIVAAAVVILGFWVTEGGGYLLPPLGGAIALGGAGYGLLALRRLRFSRTGAAPGIVEVDEGQVSYMGPQVGGMVSLPDLVELRIISIRGRRLWRLKQADGQAILIPLEASGAEALFDAFAALPGMSSAALVAAVEPPKGADSRAVMAGGENRLVWRREGRGVVAR